MNINVPQRYADIDESTIIRALSGLGVPTLSININTEARSGRYIYFDYDGVRHYICFAEKTTNGRNSFLMQYLPPAYRAFMLDGSHQKKISIFFPYFFSATQPIAAYHLFVNRLAKTIDINLINESAAFNGIISRSYDNISELILDRSVQSQANTSNRSSYFEKTGDDVTIYAKLYGANAMESFILAVAAQKLSQTGIICYPVVEHSTSQMAASTMEVFEKLRIKVMDPIAKILDATEVRRIEKSSSRKTARFHFNLLEKFGTKRCYMCGCDVETAIIGAHIHRITDIDSSELSFDEKVILATDGDNGLWLCATHDKFYEYGTIYYNDEFEVVISNAVSDKQREYINWMTLSTEFLPEHRNQKTKDYLEQHRARVVAPPII